MILSYRETVRTLQLGVTIYGVTKSRMAYCSNLSSEQVLELLEEGSTNHDWLISDEESSSESGEKTGFHGGEKNSLDIEQHASESHVTCQSCKKHTSTAVNFILQGIHPLRSPLPFSLPSLIYLYISLGCRLKA